MRPTEEMVRLVRARASVSRRFSLAMPRWATVRAAVALVVLAIASTLLLRAPPAPQLAYVRQREGFPAEKGVVVRGTPTGKGPQRGAACLAPTFQLQERGAQFVEGIDLRAPPAESLSLTAEDNYRLHLKPTGTCYVYIFQHTASGDLVRLYPNETYNAVQNPLRRGRPVYVPAAPNWLYADGETGRERLTVIASTEPLPELEDRYTRYVEARQARRPQALADLLAWIDPARGALPGSASGWTFAFDHR
jgi:hypothetical protein